MSRVILDPYNSLLTILEKNFVKAEDIIRIPTRKKPFAVHSAIRDIDYSYNLSKMMVWIASIKIGLNNLWDNPNIVQYCDEARLLHDHPIIGNSVSWIRDENDVKNIRLTHWDFVIPYKIPTDKETMKRIGEMTFKTGINPNDLAIYCSELGMKLILDESSIPIDKHYVTLINEDIIDFNKKMLLQTVLLFLKYKNYIIEPNTKNIIWGDYKT